MKAFRDEHGFLRARFDPPKEALSQFIEGDIQGDTDECRVILDEMLEIKSGRKEKFESNGNAYSLTVTKDKARLVSHFEEIELDVPLDEFIQAVSGWLKFLESPEYKADRR